MEQSKSRVFYFAGSEKSRMDLFRASFISARLWFILDYYHDLNDAAPVNFPLIPV
jgi:hypothetical protein